MKTQVDGRLVMESQRFGFRFACDDCVHFDAAKERCSLGYEACPRRDAMCAGHLLFCKAFEAA